MTFWCDRLPLHCLSLVTKSPEGQPFQSFAPIPADFSAALVAMCDGEVSAEEWQVHLNPEDDEVMKSSR